MSDLDLEHLSPKEAKYDEIFLSILQQEGKIEPFLDVVFKFLYRRTDFFLIQETSDQPYGFPASVAKQIVTKTFQKYDAIPKENLKKRLLNSNQDLVSKVKDKTQKPQPLEAPKQEKCAKPKRSELVSLPISDSKDEQEMFQKNPSSYNGAIRDNYSWTQSIKDIDVRVKINPSIKTSKDVKVNIEKEHLKVSVKDENSWKFLMSDQLPWKVKPDECTWSLFPGDHIHIYLEKVQERWWENLLVNEQKINLKNINPEKPLDELDQESQVKIKQMMFDEQQKRLGLPTIEEQRNIEILKKAWDADGSDRKSVV